MVLYGSRVDRELTSVPPSHSPANWMSGNTDLELLVTNDVRIEMEDKGGRPLSPKKLSAAQTDDCKAEERGSDGKDAEKSLPSEVEVVETVQLPQPWRWNRWYPKYDYPMVQGDPWEPLKRGVDKFDKEMCDAWNGELDTILTFTGLFSAAVTAFCIESFQSLYQSPTDTTNIFLIALSQQLANSSSPMAGFSMIEAFTPRPQDVYINVLYFVSLTLALSVSSVCILGKQWIREYQKELSVSAQDAVRVRQVRFDSLEAWKVPQIMASLPVVLLAALLLFLTGLLIQLWNVMNHTTAIAVSVVVALITILVIVTTVVPALCSMQPRRTAFTPFRSPQAWIFFVFYRRLQQWYHIIFHAYSEAPSTLASWSAFDHHFLTIEAQEWYEHGTSSVHRALRWAHEALGTSSSIGKSVHWCFQQQFHPNALVTPESNLSRYVLSGSAEDEAFDNPYHLCFEYIDKVGEYDITMRRCKLELLIRSAYHAMENTKDPWNEISYSCAELNQGMLFNLSNANQEDIRHSYAIHDQVALLFQRVFGIRPPSDSFYWFHVMCCLMQEQRRSSSPFSRQILHDLSTRQIPHWIRTFKSPPVLYNIGKAIRECASQSWEHAIELFTRMDKIMLEMCHELDGPDRESMEKWRDLRANFIEGTREGLSPAPERLRLPEGHFDIVHGPLPSLPSSHNAHENSS